MSTENFNTGLRLLPEEREALEKFLKLEISSDELENWLSRVARFTAAEGSRSVELLFQIPQPGISVNKWHIENALNKKRLGQITEAELVNWASLLLLLSDAYEFDSEHGDEVANWLNDLSWLP